MNRPEKKNALTQPMYAAMTRALSGAGANAAIRCVIFAGGPGAFCAGTDIGEFLEARAERRAAAEYRRISQSAGAQSKAAGCGCRRHSPSASAPPCCFIATMSLQRPARRSQRRSSNSALFPRRHRACSRRCAWDTRARSRCWSWAVRCRPRRRKRPASSTPSSRPPRSRRRVQGCARDRGAARRRRGGVAGADARRA